MKKAADDLEGVKKGKNTVDEGVDNSKGKKAGGCVVAKSEASLSDVVLAVVFGVVGVRADAGCNLTFDKDNLNHEYDGHAKQWGITGNRNNANLEIFKQTLQNHINSSNIQVINGTYRGQPAVFYYDPNTNLTVFTYPNGQLWGAWVFGGDQVNYLKTTGNVN